MNRPVSSAVARLVIAITCPCLFSPAASGQILRTYAAAANPFVQEMVDAGDGC
jgi:hypothetical protein